MSSPAPLTTRQVWTLYFPLALSWLFMGLEGPVSVKVISLVGNRQPIEEIWTAALNALIAIALFVESPVIDLLATTTTLCNGGRAYKTIRRFVFSTMLWCAVVHSLVVFTPIYGLIAKSYSAEVRDALWLPLVVMIPWSPMIGWRRFKQGIMIRYGRTKLIGAGTMVRLASMAGVGFVLAYLSSLSGIMIAALALMGGVTAEAIFAHFAASRIVAENLRGEDGESLSMPNLMRFHFPLTVTTMMQLGSNIMVTQTLAASIDHTTSWPGYQVALTIMWLHRAVVFALPEIIITLYSRPGSQAILKRFSLVIGGSMSLLMLIFALTGVDHWLFVNVLGVSLRTAEAAHWVFLYSCLIPVVAGAQSYVRGVLTALRETAPRMKAVLFALVAMAVIMGYGVWAHWPGAIIAAVGPTTGFIVEYVILLAAMRRAQDREVALAP